MRYGEWHNFRFCGAWPIRLRAAGASVSSERVLKVLIATRGGRNKPVGRGADEGVSGKHPSAGNAASSDVGIGLLPTQAGFYGKNDKIFC
jgi:hypothetical protein